MLAPDSIGMLATKLAVPSVHQTLTAMYSHNLYSTVQSAISILNCAKAVQPLVPCLHAMHAMCHILTVQHNLMP